MPGHFIVCSPIIALWPPTFIAITFIDSRHLSEFALMSMSASFLEQSGCRWVSHIENNKLTYPEFKHVRGETVRKDPDDNFQVNETLQETDIVLKRMLPHLYT